MARPKHTARTRGNAATSHPGKPVNPLSRRYWIFDEFPKPAQRLAATSATLAEGIQAVSCVLANSEAYRVIQETSFGYPPANLPLSPALAEGLFAALYMLNERAAEIAWEMLEPEEGRFTSCPSGRESCPGSPSAFLDDGVSLTLSFTKHCAQSRQSARSRFWKSTNAHLPDFQLDQIPKRIWVY
jgi:hypothetical protein